MPAEQVQAEALAEIQAFDPTRGSLSALRLVGAAEQHLCPDKEKASVQ